MAKVSTRSIATFATKLNVERNTQIWPGDSVPGALSTTLGSKTVTKKNACRKCRRDSKIERTTHRSKPRSTSTPSQAALHLTNCRSTRRRSIDYSNPTSSTEKEMMLLLLNLPAVMATRCTALTIKPFLASLRSISIRMLTAMICQNLITYKKITLQN